MLRHRKVVSLFTIIMLLALALSACVAPAPAADAPAADAPAADAPAADASGEPIKIGVSMLFDDLWLTILRDAIT